METAQRQTGDRQMESQMTLTQFAEIAEEQATEAAKGPQTLKDQYDLAEWLDEMKERGCGGYEHLRHFTINA